MTASGLERAARGGWIFGERYIADADAEQMRAIWQTIGRKLSGADEDCITGDREVRVGVRDMSPDLHLALFMQGELRGCGVPLVADDRLPVGEVAVIVRPPLEHYGLGLLERRVRGLT